MATAIEAGLCTTRNEDDWTLFNSITVQNLLSFGPDAEPLPLESLNVLIGPNGSGKSNLLEAIALLRGAPHSDSPFGMRSLIARGGGISEWIWKGNPHGSGSVEAILDYPSGNQRLRHAICFKQENQVLHLEDERIENESPSQGEADSYFYYRYQRGKPVVNVAGADKRGLQSHAVERDLSVLSQLKDPVSYPELTFVSECYGSIRLFREWYFGKRDTPLRTPQKPDLPNVQLEENFSNLPLFLNRIAQSHATRQELLSAFVNLYEGLTDFGVRIEGGTVQVYFSEGEFVIPATRLSEGSVRFLCLLAVLCDPDPPPFIGIEEPEIGLHPDILPKVAQLLVNTSKRTQVVVTTHSDVLVDALTDIPNAVVVCEKHNGRTTMRRLNKEELAPWLETYRLGELWSRGDIGGNRW